MGRDTYRVTIGAVSRDLPLFQVKQGLRIAVLNILGDTELAEAAATVLAGKLATLEYDVLVTPEAKSIPLAHALSVRVSRPYVVLRKSYKPYMGNALEATTVSITTGSPQTLYLDEKDRRLVEGRRVVLLDDVVSTGSTLQGMQALMEQAGGRIVGTAAICTEGDADQGGQVIAAAHLPLFTD
ncbi:MAG: hypothetical protein JJU06_12265 [Ectothiorhodospiraceae bacterium]|nr:hypothetical protein [Ectothiorhodospiraceae bacterium]MCH8503198.1 hypothetical protein [Ectothiorhodospiraceae bacterium]